MHWYVVAEAAFVVYQFAWLLYFLTTGQSRAARSTALPLLAVGGLCCCYGDDREGRPACWCAAPRLVHKWASWMRGRLFPRGRGEGTPLQKCQDPLLP